MRCDGTEVDFFLHESLKYLVMLFLARTSCCAGLTPSHECSASPLFFHAP